LFGLNSRGLVGTRRIGRQQVRKRFTERVLYLLQRRLADHVPCVAININEHSRGIYRVIGIILVGCRIGVIRIRQVDDGGFADWHDGQAHDIGQVKLTDFGRRFEDIETAYLLVARAQDDGTIFWDCLPDSGEKALPQRYLPENCDNAGKDGDEDASVVLR